MALHTLRTNRGIWNLDLTPSNIIGNGAYGIVYKARDGKGREIAAKRIDTRQRDRLQGIVPHLEKLITLDHANIVKVFDVHQEDDIVWMIMELCEFGNLNKYCSNRKLTLDVKLAIMEQIANGIIYLHENNIIHRDIKPENILVASNFPVHVKLTDFDVSKFLDEFYKTSAMSTNVGTMAFKAPEFFQRNSQRKLKYHRNVDIYAAGLTYLALQQHSGTDKPLLPQIETPRDDSERHVPSIGQLIAERKKHGEEELAVVADTATSAANTNHVDVTSEIRTVIKVMTRDIPEERFSGAEVVKALQDVHQNLRGMRDGEENKRTSEGASEKSVKRQRSNQMVLTRGDSWSINSPKARLICAVGDKVVVHRLVEDTVYVSVFNKRSRKLMADVECLCERNYYFSSSICRHPVDTLCILETSGGCDATRSINISTREITPNVCVEKFEKLCSGPAGSVLALTEDAEIVQLLWRDEHKTLKKVNKVKTNVAEITTMCYVGANDVVVFASHSRGRLTAVGLCDGAPVWELKNPIEGREVSPWGVCTNPMGQLFVSDWNNGIILLLNSETGEVLQTLLESEGLKGICDICWSGSSNELIVSQSTGEVHMYEATN